MGGRQATVETTATARERALSALEERELFTLYRRRAGVTQEAVAAVTGISQPTISWWERGRCALPVVKVEALWAAVEELAAGAEAVA